VLVHFGRKRNGEVAIYVNHLSTYPKGSLQSTNFVAIVKIDPNVKDFFFEKFFIDAGKFNFDCANSATDNEFTVVGIDSGYVGIYIIQHLQFYKTIMFRWSTTVNITDFKKYSRMYAIRMSLSQLGVRAFACLDELEFYETGGPNPHYHKYDRRPMGGAVKMTKDLKFIGKYALDEFTRKFDAKHLAVHGTLDDVTLSNRHAADLNQKFNNDRHGTLKYVRKTCTFSTLSSMRENLFVNPANDLLALPVDICKHTVLERDVEPIQLGTVELFFKRLCVKYAPLFRAHN